MKTRIYKREDLPDALVQEFCADFPFLVMAETVADGGRGVWHAARSLEEARQIEAELADTDG